MDFIMKLFSKGWLHMQNNVKKERKKVYLLHPDTSLADDMLQPLHAHGVQWQVKGQLCLRQYDGQGARVLVTLQLTVKDQGHDNDTLLGQDKKLHVHGAALGASKDLPVQCVIGQERDLAVAEEHRLLALGCPDVTHPWAQDVVPVGKGGSQQRAFSVNGHL